MAKNSSNLISDEWALILYFSEEQYLQSCFASCDYRLELQDSQNIVKILFVYI